MRISLSLSILLYNNKSNYYYDNLKLIFKTSQIWSWACGSVTECMFSKVKALSSIPSTFQSPKEGEVNFLLFSSFIFRLLKTSIEANLP
jgi:hypothetical protein